MQPFHLRRADTALLLIAILTACTASSDNAGIFPGEQSVSSDQEIAQSQEQSAAPRTLTGAELDHLLRGKVILFADLSTATYHLDNTYTFKGRGEGRVWQGRWHIEGERVCIRFSDGGGRCDSYSQAGSGYYLVNARGTRFAVQTITPA